MIWKYQKALGACCSVAVVVFFGYIGAMFLSLYVVLHRSSTSWAPYYNLTAGVVLVTVATLCSVNCCLHCTSDAVLNLMHQRRQRRAEETDTELTERDRPIAIIVNGSRESRELLV